MLLHRDENIRNTARPRSEEVPRCFARISDLLLPRRLGRKKSAGAPGASRLIIVETISFRNSYVFNFKNISTARFFVGSIFFPFLRPRFPGFAIFFDAMIALPSIDGFRLPIG